MASLAEIQRLLEEIRDELPSILNNVKMSPKQTVIVQGLSDISERLGLVQAGEFRVGNSVEPGFGFTGVRMGYPSFTYEGEEWHIAGVNNDKLQFGFRATDGKGVAGGGSIVLDEDGMTLPDSGDAIVFQDAADLVYSFIAQRRFGGTAALDIFTVELSTETNQISNGDFETGDLTGWTETDPGAEISTAATDKGTSALFASGISFTSYIEQSLSATASNGCVVTLKAKLGAAGAATIYVGDSTLDQNIYLTSEEWRNLTFVFNDSFSSLLIAVSASADTYIDDIVVRPIQVLGGGRNMTIRPGEVRIAEGSFIAPYLSSFPDELNRYLQGVIFSGPIFREADSADVTGNLTDYYTGDGLYSILKLNTTGATELRSMHYYSHNNVSFTFAGGLFNGRLVTLMNVGGNNLTVKDNYATGTNAESRFDLGGVDLVIAPDGVATFWYDPITTMWRLFSNNRNVT